MARLSTLFVALVAAIATLSNVMAFVPVNTRSGALILRLGVGCLGARVVVVSVVVIVVVEGGRYSAGVCSRESLHWYCCRLLLKDLFYLSWNCGFVVIF